MRLTLLLLLVSLLFSLAGGVTAAFLGGDVLSLGSLVGFVTVLGIAARLYLQARGGRAGS